MNRIWNIEALLLVACGNLIASRTGRWDLKLHLQSITFLFRLHTLGVVKSPQGTPRCWNFVLNDSSCKNTDIYKIAPVIGSFVPFASHRTKGYFASGTQCLFTDMIFIYLGYRFVYKHWNKYIEEYEANNQSPERPILTHYSPKPFFLPEHSTRTPAPLQGGVGPCQCVWKWHVSFSYQVF